MVNHEREEVATLQVVVPLAVASLQRNLIVPSHQLHHSDQEGVLAAAPNGGIAVLRSFGMGATAEPDDVRQQHKSSLLAGAVQGLPLTVEFLLGQYQQ